ncbi:hypothetical protein ABIB25_003821 [Nakamurella sp. UYEF19]|uniref:hypothetical protein n=1 Tax=Nakamurella sp. UYEF19 TaxID=1756392 RepID=UPI0033969F29
MTAVDVLTMAEAVLDGSVSVPDGNSARAAAVLARQALEEIVDERCAAVAPGLARPSMRSRLIILTALDDADVGACAQAAWDGLSRACHHHSYELQPTAGEVRDLMGLVRSVR